MNDGNYAVIAGGESQTALSGPYHESEPMAPGVAAPQIRHGEPETVSGLLVSAREALGLSAADVAARTRITLRHIDALEAGDFSALPGRPYVIGFARAYARVVGLRDAEIADAVRAQLSGSAPRSEERASNQFEVGDPAKTPTRFVGWLALALVGAILAFGGIFWRSYYAPAVPLPSLVHDDGQSRPDPKQTPHASRPQPSGAQLATDPVVFTALEEGVWVKFYDGQGKQLMQKQLAKGETYTVPPDAQGPRIWTGRPDALSITIGGQPIPRLAEKEGIVKDIAVDAASLRGRSAQETAAGQPAARSTNPETGSPVSQ